MLKVLATLAFGAALITAPTAAFADDNSETNSEPDLDAVATACYLTWGDCPALLNGPAAEDFLESQLSPHVPTEDDVTAAHAAFPVLNGVELEGATEVWDGDSVNTWELGSLFDFRQGWLPVLGQSGETSFHSDMEDVPPGAWILRGEGGWCAGIGTWAICHFK